MFNFFENKNNYKVEDDKTWLDKNSKLKGLYNDLIKKTGKKIFLISYFEASLKEISLFFDDLNFKYKYIEHFNEIEKSHDLDEPIYILTTNWQLRKDILTSINSLPSAQTFVFLDHYPIFKPEADILNLIGQGQKQTTVQFYNSMDNPFFDFFGGENIKNAMIKMGINKDECLSSGLINKSIKKGQQKLELEIISDRKSDSIENWFKNNKKKQF